MNATAIVDAARLERFLDDALGDRAAINVTPMTGGGSCEVFAVDRGAARWVLRRAPRHANVATAHDVLREFRILDAIKDEPVPIARPVVACADEAVFGAPFYVMERIDGRPILQSVPAAWAAAPETHGQALEELVDALVAIHAVDWNACGLGRPGPPRRLLVAPIRVAGSRSSTRTAGASCPPRTTSRVGSTRTARPSGRARCATATTSSTTCSSPPTLRRSCSRSSTGRWRRSVTRWSISRGRSSSIPERRARCRSAWPRSRRSTARPARSRARSSSATRRGRDATRPRLGWYDVFARWKLAIALEGSYAKFQRGQSDKPIHEFFGSQVDLLLDERGGLIDEGAA